MSAKSPEMCVETRGHGNKVLGSLRNANAIFHVNQNSLVVGRHCNGRTCSGFTYPSNCSETELIGNYNVLGIFKETDSSILCAE